MTGEILIIISVVFSYTVLGILIFILYFDKKRLQYEQNDLLNRIMSRNYQEYAQIEAKKLTVKEVEEKSKILFEEKDVFPVD